MFLDTVVSRSVWLGLVAFQKLDQDDLLGALVSTERLFGSISSVSQCLKMLEDVPQFWGSLSKEGRASCPLWDSLCLTAMGPTTGAQGPVALEQQVLCSWGQHRTGDGGCSVCQAHCT